MSKKSNRADQSHSHFSGLNPSGHGKHRAAGEATFGFTFSEDNSSVLSFSALSANGSSLNLDTTGLVPTVGTNALGASAVVSVAQSYADGNFSHTKLFTDADGDTKYVQSFELHVAKALSNKLEKHKFTFDASNAVTQDLEQVLTRWGASTTFKADPITANEKYAKITLGSDVYVVKTETITKAAATTYAFEVYHDSNADGVWTEVARGISDGTYVSAGALDLSQIQTQLAASASVIG